jgi:hypothetical protein
VRISTAGGSDPQWRGDGRELYYVASDNTLMAVAAPSRAWFEPAIPEPLFRKSFDTVSLTFSSAYAPDVDGQRFLVTETVEGDRPRLIVTLNWTTNQ